MTNDCDRLARLNDEVEVAEYVLFATWVAEIDVSELYQAPTHFLDTGLLRVNLRRRLDDTEDFASCCLRLGERRQLRNRYTRAN